MGQTSNDHQQRRGQPWRRAVTMAAALAAAGAVFTAGGARADVNIASEWTPVSNTNGYTYYDGFTNYSGNPLAQVNINGNNWLQLDDANAYWGQFTGQMWANNTLSTTNVNANPHVEFDINLKDWHWGNLDYKVEMGNDNGAGGTEGGQGGPNAIAHLGYLTHALPSATGNPITQHISV